MCTLINMGIHDHTPGLDGTPLYNYMFALSMLTPLYIYYMLASDQLFVRGSSAYNFVKLRALELGV